MHQIKQYTRAKIREITLKRWKERRKIMEQLHKADKLLKENGFNLCSIEELKYRKETRQWRENGYLEITFNEDKTLDISFNNSLPVFITMQELQAINEKVKELGWPDKKIKEKQ